jgi:hypothetical protein
LPQSKESFRKVYSNVTTTTRGAKLTTKHTLGT